MANYIKCSDRVHKLVKVRAAQTGQEMQQIAERALEAYLSAGTSIAGGKQDTRNNVMELPLSKIDAKWHNSLALVLKDGTPEEQATLKGLLEFYVGQIRKRSAIAGGSATDDGPPQGDHPKTGTGRRKHKAD